MADEYPIGSIRIFKGRKLKVVEDDPQVRTPCGQCCVYVPERKECSFTPRPALCYDREDGVFIHYEEVAEDGDDTEEHY